MTKPTKPKKPQQPVYPSGLVSTPGTVLGNDSGHGLAKLGDEYLEAAKILNDALKSTPKWPIYENAFQALELYLKAYLLLKGGTLPPAPKYWARFTSRPERSKSKGPNPKVKPRG